MADLNIQTKASEYNPDKDNDDIVEEDNDDGKQDKYIPTYRFSQFQEAQSCEESDSLLQRKRLAFSLCKSKDFILEVKKILKTHLEFFTNIHLSDDNDDHNYARQSCQKSKLDTYKVLFSSKSARSVGKLSHIRNKYWHINVKADVQHCFNEATELLRFARTSYVLASDLSHMKSTTYSDLPEDLQTDQA
ncbi:unnamed protein product [Mytilus coruscus]|uniref:Uncharacterized protein n=1 Tax=Mytilus coruscus TaxID=42192 RepID=A0A6J8A9R4_MYTCO|nr:unnamed protein product [Mytilus coruscus]